MIDFKTAIYQKIVALLRATPELVTPNVGKPAKIEDLTTPVGTARQFMTKSPGEYPVVKLMPGRFSSTGFARAGTQTFATEDPNFVTEGYSQQIQRTFEFSIICASDLLRLDQADPVEEAVQVALIRGGPRLGLPYVVSWTIPDARQVATDKDEAKGTMRFVTTIRLALVCVFESSTFYAS